MNDLRMTERRVYALKAYRRARRYREWHRRVSTLASQLQSRWRTFGAFLDQSIVGPYLVGLLTGAVLLFIAWKGFSLAIADLKHDVHLIKNAVAQGDLCSRDMSSAAGQHTIVRRDD